jgi:hypothetical protein
VSRLVSKANEAESGIDEGGRTRMYGTRSVVVGGVHLRLRTSSMILRRVAVGGESFEAGRMGDDDSESVLRGGLTICSVTTFVALRAPHGPTTDADAVDSSSAGNSPSNSSSEMHVRSSFSSSAASVGSAPPTTRPRHPTGGRPNDGTQTHPKGSPVGYVLCVVAEDRLTTHASVRGGGDVCTCAVSHRAHCQGRILR